MDKQVRMAQRVPKEHMTTRFTHLTRAFRTIDEASGAAAAAPPTANLWSRCCRLRSTPPLLTASLTPPPLHRQALAAQLKAILITFNLGVGDKCSTASSTWPTTTVRERRIDQPSTAFPAREDPASGLTPHAPPPSFPQATAT